MSWSSFLLTFVLITYPLDLWYVEQFLSFFRPFLYVYWNPSIALSYFYLFSVFVFAFSLYLTRFCVLCLCRSLDFIAIVLCGIVTMHSPTGIFFFSVGRRCCRCVSVYILLWLVWFTLVLIVAHNRKGKHASLWQYLEIFESFHSLSLHLRRTTMHFCFIISFLSPFSQRWKQKFDSKLNSVIKQIL